MACGVALLLLCAVTFLGGKVVLYGIHKTESGPCEAMVSGSVVLFIYMLMCQVVTVKLGLAFSLMKYAVAIYAAVAILVGLGIVCKELMQKKKELPENRKGLKWPRILLAGVGVTFLLNVVTIEIYEPYLGVDMTVEETGTIVESNSVCRYHPGTGQELMLGMNASAKLNFIPSLYAVLCAWTGADNYDFVCYAAPVWGLFLNYMAVALLLKQIIGKKGETEILLGGMLIYGVLVLMGDYHSSTYAFGLLHEGWKPGVILKASGTPVVLSALIAAVRLICARRERRKTEHAECVE